MPRSYLHHSVATVQHLRRAYGRQTMTEIGAELGIPALKLHELARRHGIKKPWRTPRPTVTPSPPPPQPL